MNKFLLLLVSLLYLSFTVPYIQEEWKNPEIILKLKPRERAIQQYPLSRNKKDTHENVKGFYEFGERMSDRFSKSGMTISEATIVYQLIFTENIIRNGSYSIPSPGKKISQPDAEDLKEIVSVKKIEEGTYEIFYSYLSCGTRYVHQVIVIDEGKIIDRKIVERWSGNYPC